jgi:TRAP-type C4-dicarboxylate transport system permease small subunit
MDYMYWLVKLIGKIEGYIAATLLLITCLVNWLQIFSRTIFDNALTWPEEISVIMFLYFVFLGAGALYIKQADVAVDWFVQNYMPNKQELIFRCIMFLNLVTFLVLFFGGLNGFHHAMKFTSGAAIPVPRAYLRIPIIIMSTSSIFTSIVYFFIPFSKVNIE